VDILVKEVSSAIKPSTGIAVSATLYHSIRSANTRMQLLTFDHEGCLYCVFDKEGNNRSESDLQPGRKSRSECRFMDFVMFPSECQAFYFKYLIDFFN
jgi:hypothetical protein